MVIYDSAQKYIESKTALCDKIAAINAIITALESASLKAAEKDEIEEYWLDDGQTKIRTIYKGAEAVAKSIDAFERIKQRYVNKLNGHHMRLVDSKSLRR